MAAPNVRQHEMEPLALAVALTTFVVGAVAGWAAARAAARRDLAAAAQLHEGTSRAHQALLLETTRRLDATLDELKTSREAAHRMLSDSAALRENNAQLRTEVAHLKETIPEKVALIAKAEEQLRATFNASAAAALRATTEEFLKLADQKLGNVQKDAAAELGRRHQAFDELVKPIKDVLTQVDQKVGDSEKNRLQTSAAIETLLKDIHQQQDRIRSETHHLVRALRTPSVRGRWGEMQLRRVVELAGMLDYCDFDEQPSLLGETGRQRPDLIVKLPGNRTIVIDAKVPLEAYLDAQEAPDDPSRARKMLDHARQVRDHMTKLGSKSYWDSVQPSPDFAVMFLPGEAFFQSALQHDPQLIEYRRARAGVSGEPAHADRASSGRLARVAARAARPERGGDPGAGQGVVRPRRQDDRVYGHAPDAPR